MSVYSDTCKKILLFTNFAARGESTITDQFVTLVRFIVRLNFLTSMKLERITIYPKDIQRITGRSERYGRTLIKKIRLHFNKAEHHFITIEEFCEFTGLKIDHVRQHVN